MALDSNRLNQYHYFRHFPPDETFITDFLIPNLAKQTRYYQASKGIELPHGDNETPEYLPLLEATKLIIDFLLEHSYLREQESSRLEGLLKQKRFTDLANYLQLVTQTRITNPQRLLTSRLTENLLAYHQAQASTQPSPATTDHLKVLKEYQQLHQYLLQRAQSDSLATQISQLLPHRITSLDSNLTRTALTNLLISQLPQLTSIINQHPDNPQLAQRRLANHLKQAVLNSHPELSNLISFLPAKETELLQTVQNLQGTFQDLPKYRQLQAQASQAITQLIPTQYYQLQAQLQHALSSYSHDPNFNQQQVIKLIFQTISKTKQPLTSQQIIDQVGRKLHLSPQATKQLHRTLASSGLDLSLEYHQRQLFLQLHSKLLSPAERKLLKQGIDPRYTTLNLNQLRDQAQTLLPPQPLPQSDQDIAQLIQDQLTANHDFATTQSLQEWLNSYHTLSQISADRHLSRLAKRAQTQREFLDLPLSDKWYLISDTLSGRRFMRKFDRWYDDFTQNKAVITIKRAGKPDIKIPIFRLQFWLIDQIEGFKYNFAIKGLKKLRGTKNIFGKFAQFSLRHYIKGGLSIDGVMLSGWQEIWSKKIIIPTTKWATKQLAKRNILGIFKYASKPFTQAAKRTTTRLLLKISTRSIAKFGGKAIFALTTALTGIGSVVGVILSATLILDIAKLGIHFIKKFFKDVDFRNKILGITTVITGALAGLGLASIWPFIASISALALQGLLISAGISLGILAFAMIFFNIFIKLPEQIDTPLPGPASMGEFQNIQKCTDENPILTDPVGPNRIAQTAHNIVDDLHQGFWCYWNRPANPQKSAQYPQLFSTPDVVRHPSTNHPNLFDYEFYANQQNPTYTEMSTHGDALYWCTYLVIHSYRLSDHKEIELTLWSPTMQADFEKRGKFIPRSETYMDSATGNTNVVSGSVIFFKTNSGPDRTNHVGIINAVNKGMVTFYQSNAGTKTGHTVFDSAGHLQNLAGMAIVGIGLP